MIKTKIQIIVILLSILITAISYADKPVIMVDTKEYTSDELKKIMEENGFNLPDQAIQKLQRDAVLKKMKKDEKEVYEKSFGSSLEKDNVRTKARDLPIISKQAGNRKFMFTTWLNEKAQKIPIKYLDMEGYWAMVKETESYKVRAETGMEMSSNQISYTFAELSVPEKEVLASKGREVYLDGKEYNKYVIDNYNEIDGFVKRNKSKAECINYLIEKIAGEKALLETMEKKEKEEAMKNKENGVSKKEEEEKELSIEEELDIERGIRGYVLEHMFDGELSLKDKEYMSPSEMMEDIYYKYEKGNTKKVKALKQALAGKPSVDKEDEDIRRYVKKMRLSKIRKDIEEKMDSKEIYDWMEKTDFWSNYKDAQIILANERYKEQIAESLKNNKIKLNLIKK